MLTAIITTAIITFVVSLFTTKWLFGVAVTALNDKIEKCYKRNDVRYDRFFHNLNNVKQTLQNNIDDMGKNSHAEMRKMDEHLHDLIEEGEDTHREDMRMLLSLINVESISKNAKEGLVLATYFDGSRKISKLDKSVPFVPVKATKLKKGAEITEYMGEKLEFTLPANTDF